MSTAATSPFAPPGLVPSQVLGQVSVAPPSDSPTEVLAVPQGGLTSVASGSSDHAAYGARSGLAASGGPAASAGPAVLDLRHITRTVVLPDGSDLHILRDINLQVADGEHVSIVGRSGTGKSTLLNLIGLLDKPSSGMYLLGNHDVTRLNEGRLARLRGRHFGFVFQQFNIFPERTALENVEVPLLYATGQRFWNRRAIAADMLERVGLSERIDSYPTELSGGEQQRIAIARALVRTPRIILADEPTGALDPETGATIMQLLEDVANQHASALIVITHDLNVAKRANRVLALSEGSLHPVDTTHQGLAAQIAGDGVAARSSEGAR